MIAYDCLTLKLPKSPGPYLGYMYCSLFLYGNDSYVEMNLSLYLMHLNTFAYCLFAESHDGCRLDLNVCPSFRFQQLKVAMIDLIILFSTLNHILYACYNNGFCVFQLSCCEPVWGSVVKESSRDRHTSFGNL